MRGAAVGGDVGRDATINLRFERSAIAGDTAIDPFEAGVAGAVIGVAENDEAPGEARGRDARGGDLAYGLRQIGGTTDDEMRHRIERGKTVRQQSLDLAGRLSGNQARCKLLADDRGKADGFGQGLPAVIV